MFAGQAGLSLEVLNLLVMADKTVPTREQLKKLKVATLRQRLSKLSLPQAGMLPACSVNLRCLDTFLILPNSLRKRYVLLVSVSM